MGGQSRRTKVVAFRLPVSEAERLERLAERLEVKVSQLCAGIVVREMDAAEQQEQDMIARSVGR